MTAPLTADAGADQLEPRQRAHPQHDDSLERVMSVLIAVQKWVDAEKRVAKVYVSVEHGIFHIRAASVSEPDFELTTSLANLASSLTDRGFDAAGSRILNLPTEELTAFFDPSECIVFYRQ